MPLINLIILADRLQLERGHRDSFFLDLTRSVSNRLQDIQAQLTPPVLEQLSSCHLRAPISTSQALVNRVCDEVKARLSPDLVEKVKTLFQESFKIGAPSPNALPAFLSEPSLRSQAPSSQSTVAKGASSTTPTGLTNPAPIKSGLFCNTSSRLQTRERLPSQDLEPNAVLATSPELETSATKTSQATSSHVIIFEFQYQLIIYSYSTKNK